MRLPFAHNDVCISCRPPHAPGQLCRSQGEQEHRVRRSRADSVYSVDGTVTPLRVTLEIIDKSFPADNANLVIDEAHATGLYVPGGRGMVALLGLVDCVLAQLPALGSPRGQVVRDSTYQYMLRDGLVFIAMSLTKHFSQLRAPVDLCNLFHQCYYHRLPASFDRLEDSTVELVRIPAPLPLSLSLINGATLYIYPLKACGASSRKLHTGLPPFFPHLPNNGYLGDICKAVSYPTHAIVT
jgi:hypothetical protein